MSTYVFFSLPFLFLFTVHLQYQSFPIQIHPLGGGALPDINDAVGVP